ncbi:DUF3817 domain-containing protein [Actinophytocola sediminis]
MTSPQPPLTDEEHPAQATGESGIRGALARYRVLAYIVGVGLLALCLAMMMKYAFDQDSYMAVVGPVHGFLYVVYLLAAVDLAIKARWSMKGTVLIMLAGMVPFVSFIAERQVARKVRAGVAL